MAMTRWDRDLGWFQNRMNRLFEDVFRGGLEQDWGLAGWAPPVDVYEHEGNLVLKAELPGVKPEDLRVHVENNVLTISGERELEQDVKREHYHRIERAYGSFSRSFTLSPQYEQDKIQADFKDGVLKIAVPRSERARPRQIPVAGAAQQALPKEAGRPAKVKDQQMEEEVGVRR